jgi:hypothetical protein
VLWRERPFSCNHAPPLRPRLPLNCVDPPPGLPIASDSGVLFFAPWNAELVLKVGPRKKPGDDSAISLLGAIAYSCASSFNNIVSARGAVGKNGFLYWPPSLLCRPRALRESIGWHGGVRRTSFRRSNSEVRRSASCGPGQWSHVRGSV